MNVIILVLSMKSLSSHRCKAVDASAIGFVCLVSGIAAYVEALAMAGAIELRQPEQKFN